MFYLTSSSSLLSASPLWLSFIALYCTWRKKKNLIQQGKLAGKWFIYDNQNSSFFIHHMCVSICCSCCCNKTHACWINVCILTYMCGYTILNVRIKERKTRINFNCLFNVVVIHKNRRQIRWEEWQRERVRYRTSCGVLSHCLCHYLAISQAAISALSVWFYTYRLKKMLPLGCQRNENETKKKTKKC